jgi:hypothetical protein
MRLVVDHEVNDAGRVVGRVLSPAEYAAEIPPKKRAFHYEGHGPTVDAFVAASEHPGSVTRFRVMQAGPLQAISRAIARAADREDPIEALDILATTAPCLAQLETAAAVGRKLISEAYEALEKEADSRGGSTPQEVD